MKFLKSLFASLLFWPADYLVGKFSLLWLWCWKNKFKKKTKKIGWYGSIESSIVCSPEREITATIVE